MQFVITADITKALTEKWPEGKDLTEQGKGDYFNTDKDQ